MHFFGLLGSLMFVLGLIAIILVGAIKLYDMHHGNPYRLVTESPYFYISLTMMILGTLLFLAGFLGELITRNAPERNHYKVGNFYVALFTVTTIADCCPFATPFPVFCDLTSDLPSLSKFKISFQHFV